MKTQDAFTAPIHTAPGDDGRPYGIWASGPDYKVSFHDGMAFYPVLGVDAARNTPLRWHTTSVRHGSSELADGGEAVPVRVGPWRFEYGHANFVEAYDVRADGVEQTFVLRRPVGTDGGDLVIRGRFETDLGAPPAVADHREIVFRDDSGRAVVSYGAATAIDAAGRTAAMTTAWDGTEMRLRLSGDWLRDARFPVTVDPLVSTVVVSLGTSVEEPHVAEFSNQMVTVFTRYVSATDADLYARMSDASWGTQALIYTDVTNQWTTPSADVAYAKGALKWLIAFQRGFPSSQSSYLRYHRHDWDDRSLGTVYSVLTNVVGEQSSNPSVGGSNNFDDQAVVVYEVNRGSYLENTLRTELWATILDCATNTKSTAFRVDGGTTGTDSEHPDVSSRRGVYKPWMITYQQQDDWSAGGRWRARIGRIHEDRRVDGPYTVSDQSYLNHVRPRIDGASGRYYVSYASGGLQRQYYAKTTGFYVRAARFDWDEGSFGGPTVQPSFVVRGTYGGPEVFYNASISHDYNTASHWLVLTADETGSGAISADRVAYGGGIAESLQLAAPAWRASTIYSATRRGFPTVYTSGGNVLANTMVYPQTGVTTVGTPCGRASALAFGSHSTAPYAGSTKFAIEMWHAPNNASAFLILSAGTASLPLDPIGMPGCTLYVDLAQPNVLFPVNLIGTNAAVTVPIPAPLQTTLWAQWIYTNVGATPLGFETTNGLQIDIR